MYLSRFGQISIEFLYWQGQPFHRGLRNKIPKALDRSSTRKSRQDKSSRGNARNGRLTRSSEYRLRLTSNSVGDRTRTFVRIHLFSLACFSKVMSRVTKMSRSDAAVLAKCRISEILLIDVDGRKLLQLNFKVHSEELGSYLTFGNACALSRVTATTLLVFVSVYFN